MMSYVHGRDVKKRYSLWLCTIFYKEKEDKIKMLEILDSWMNKTSTKSIAFEKDFSIKFVRRLINKVSKIFLPRYYEIFDFLGGDNTIIEIDESKFGKRKYNKVNHVDGIWVLSMVERSIHKIIKLITLDNRTKESLHRIIKRYIKKYSVLYTDG
ncbi:hypothetical protein DMUE_0600 [Dictyocoela muelleri]|nr:hypothetical protein DMUE_0600 [Dictyocoela muelleri]